jgi:hypothetical protein
MNARKEDGKIRVIYKDCPIFGPLPKRAALDAIPSDLQRIHLAVHERLMRALVGNDDDLRTAVGFQQAIGVGLERYLAQNELNMRMALKPDIPPSGQVRTLAKRGSARAEPLFVHEI